MSKPKRGKRFVYSLGTLLKVREIRERQQREVFEVAEKMLHEERLKEAEVKDQQQAHLDYVRGLLSSGELPPLGTIQMHQQHVKTMESRVEEQVEEVKKAETKRDDEREELVQKSKEKQIIEKDKDKTRLAWKKMMDKEAAQFLDEIASIKFASKMIQDDDA